MRAHGRDERGVAVVLAITAISALTALALVCGGVTATVVAHRQLQSAADLAALAGASALRDGVAPCSAAQHIAESNRVQLTSCAVEGNAVRLEVRVRLVPVLGSRELTARARAGPTGAG